MSEAPTASKHSEPEVMARVRLIVVVAGVPIAVWLLWAYGWKVAVTFLLGAAASSGNLVWLRRSTGQLMDRMEGPAAGGGGAVVAKFMLRFGLLACVAFVIIQSSAVNVYALVFGLALPIVAIMMEAFYQAWQAVRHGTDPDPES